jgi:nucleoside-diphosphate-sugar epimerase
MRHPVSEAAPMSAPVLFCFGYGYSARALAALLRPRGWQVRGTGRSEEACAAMAADGIAAFRFDRDRPLGDATAALAGATHLLSSVPPDAAGDAVLDHHAADIAACASGIAWCGYLSTTGVYGDHAGDWIDETTALTPATERGRRRVAAEAGWCNLWRDAGLPVHLFRLAGIYGPGRNALATVRAGRAQRIVKPGQVFSRIHVDDIAAVLAASIGRPDPGAAYNVCDDDPAPPQDVIAHACELLGVDPPPEIPFAEAALSPMARSFYAESKRVANDRIKRELGVTLRYPDYRAGLAALHAGF